MFSVICLFGCWCWCGLVEVVLVVFVGKLLDIIGVVEDDWGLYFGSFGEFNGELLIGGFFWVFGGKEMWWGSDIVG